MNKFFFILIIALISCQEIPKVQEENNDISIYNIDNANFHDTIIIQLLNGTGISNLARYISDTLRLTKFVHNDTLYYFDVIEKDNWKDLAIERCFIVERDDSNGKNVKILSIAFNIEPPLIELKENEVYEVTIIIGPDYEKYFGAIDSSKNIW